MYLKQMAERNAQRFNTRDPFKLAESLGIIVLHVDLDGILGFYHHIMSCNVIYIANHISEPEARFICAHLIGHVLLHQETNLSFLELHTSRKTNRYDVEADRFAVNLLYSDRFISGYLNIPIAELAKCLNVYEELASYRLRTVEEEHL